MTPSTPTYTLLVTTLIIFPYPPHVFLMQIQTNTNKDSFFFFLKENSQMFQGRPCKNMYPNEYFPHGITNGASWYNVPGKILLYQGHAT